MLSINFNPAPFKVVQKTATVVKLMNKAGVQLKRNTVVVKKYNKHTYVANGNRDQVVQASSMIQADEPGPSRVANSF